MTTTNERISMRSARIFAGMTQEDACTAIGVELPQLIAWENGKRIPSHEHVAKMAEVYGMTMDEISFQKEDNTTEYDNSYLRAKILDKYHSLDEFASAVKMSPKTLESRLSAHSDFTLEEVECICSALNAKDMEIKRLFFTPKDETVMVSTKACVTMTKELTPDEFDLLMNIMDLVKGRTDRHEFAIGWTGRMKDLPAALVRI